MFKKIIQSKISNSDEQKYIEGSQKKAENKDINQPNKGLVLVHKNQIFIITNALYCAACLILAIFFIFLVLRLAPKTNGYPCSLSSDCEQYSEYGLKCIDQTCTCDSRAFFDGKNCSLKNGYLGFCQNDNACKFPFVCLSTACKCKDGRWWNGSDCDTQRNNGETCSFDNQCLVHKGSYCSNNTCSCKVNYFWSGSMCEVVKDYLATCSIQDSCNSTKLLFCSQINSTVAKCICPILFYWDSITATCTQQKNASQPCVSSVECRSDLGLECDNNGQCSCKNGFYWHSNSVCNKSASINETCSLLIPCDSSNLLSCNSSKCVCSSTFFWSNQKCIPKLLIGSSCTANNDCLDSLNLICNSSFCACPYTHFWNGSICVQKYTLGVSCVSNTQCQDYNSLYCNVTCICPIGPTWFWSVATQKCLECPSGWIVFLNHCYVYQSALLTWNDARSTCKSFGADLVTIRDAHDYAVVEQFYTQFTNFFQLWTGAKQNITYDFYWPDGSYMNSNSPNASWWCPSNPNNSGGVNAIGFPANGQPCVRMQRWPNGCLNYGCITYPLICINDWTCGDKHAFLCEKRD